MTPALDALLKEVDRAVNDPRSFREDAMDWSLAARLAMSDTAPRLAAMLRVAVERIHAARSALARTAKTEFGGKTCASCDEKSSWDAWGRAAKHLDMSGLACPETCATRGAFVEMAAIDAALARIEAMAKGEA